MSGASPPSSKIIEKTAAKERLANQRNELQDVLGHTGELSRLIDHVQFRNLTSPLQVDGLHAIRVRQNVPYRRGR